LSKVAGAVDSSLTLLGDGEGEACVGVGIAGGFASVDGGVYFETEVKVLSG